jgi:hypothetical protein
MSGTRRKAGLLGPEIEGYQAWLTRRGYTPQTIRNMLKDLGRVGRWLAARGLLVSQLNEEATTAGHGAASGLAARTSRAPRRPALPHPNRSAAQP